MSQSVDWVNVHLHLQLDPTTVVDRLRLTPEQIGSWTTQIAGGVLGIVTSLFSLLLEVFTFFVFAFYIAADGPRIRRAIGRWLPPQDAEEVFVTVWDIAAQKTGGYVISKVVLAALSSFFHAVFFWAIGVPYWLPLALAGGHHRPVHPGGRHLHRHRRAGALRGLHPPADGAVDRCSSPPSTSSSRTTSSRPA